MKFRIKEILLLVASFWILFDSSAQSSDTLKLSATEFFGWIKQYHPIVYEAQLTVKQGRSGFVAAQGAFDPKLFGKFSEKNFGGKQYFRHLQGGVKIPTWYGVEFKGYYEDNTGELLNPEYSTPEGGLLVAGASLNVSQVIMDERMLMRQKAKQFYLASQAEQRKMLNDLYYKAYVQYWDWVVAYQLKRVYQEAVSISENLYEGAVISYEQGAKPAIDTLNAYAQYQKRKTEALDAELNWRVETLKLSTYLWDSLGQPLELSEIVIPSVDFNKFGEYPNPDDWWDLQSLQSYIEGANPELVMYEAKIRQLEFEKRYKFNKVLPKIKLEYSMLSAVNPASDKYSWSPSKNQKIGASVSLPLFLREGTGGFQQAKIKLAKANWARAYKRWQIAMKVEQSLQKVELLDLQVKQYEDAVEAYQKLSEAQQLAWIQGASSLFEVNYQEQKRLETVSKWLKLKGKLYQSYMGVIWSAGAIESDWILP